MSRVLLMQVARIAMKVVVEAAVVAVVAVVVAAVVVTVVTIVNMTDVTAIMTVTMDPQEEVVTAEVAVARVAVEVAEVTPTHLSTTATSEECRVQCDRVSWNDGACICSSSKITIGQCNNR